VIRARNKQRARYRQTPHRSNSEIPGQDLRLYCPLSTEAARLLERSAAKLEMSVRAHVRVLRVARTIADLEDASTIAANHVAEALSYRGLE
jgi:magnesium chelatase family protein